MRCDLVCSLEEGFGRLGGAGGGVALIVVVFDTIAAFASGDDVPSRLLLAAPITWIARDSPWDAATG